MKTNRRKGKAEGSVLFTVVAVMMIMVVFLMSTLILTTSAHRRSYYSFYENQAQYTAQGVLDAISNAAYNDPGFYSWVKGGGGDIKVDGLASTGINNARVDARIESIPGNQYVWDEKSNTIQSQSGYMITVTAYVGKGRNTTEKTVTNYIYEKPNVQVNMSGVANLATWSGFNDMTVDVGPGDSGRNTDGTANKAKAMFLGGLANSEVSNNILCLGPQSFGTRQLPAGRGKYGTNSGVEFKNVSPSVGDAVFIGNYYSNDKKIFLLQEAGEGVQFWGNLKVQNFLEVFSDIADEGKSLYPTDYRYIPYMYVDGNLQCPNNTQIGIHDNNQPVNLYVNQLTGAPSMMYGDIYMYDPNAESSYSCASDTYLAHFVKDNVQRTNTYDKGYVGGDIFSTNSKLTISGNLTNIGGDVVMANPNGELNITLNKGATIQGAIVSAGGLNISVQNGELTVLGGIYADPAKTTISGTVNGVKDGSLEAICDAATGGYDLPWAAEDGTYARYVNTSTEAHFESFGQRGAKADSYTALIAALKKADLGAQEVGSSYYKSTNNSGYDFSMFPYCSRQDEIFTHYFRWDLAADTEDGAQSNLNGDKLVAESQAAGHTWFVTEKSAESGSKWVPFTVPHDVKVQDATAEQLLDPNYIMEHSSNSFIPMLETSSASPIEKVKAGADGTTYYNYHNDISEFTKFVTSSKVLSSMTDNIKNVSFSSVSANGTDANNTINGAFVITESMVLDISTADTNLMNKDVTVYIDPTANGYNSEKPLCIALKGYCSNTAMTILINNNCFYNKTDGKTDYSSYTTYADYSHNNPDSEPMFAGRSDVLLFFDKTIGGNKDFRVLTTGAYQMFVEKSFDIISNPIYPGTMVDEDTLVLNPNWDAMYGKADARRFELVPNVVIYGQAGTNYNGQFLNGFTSNAEVIMPDSVFGCPVSVKNIEDNSLFYREFTDSARYNPYTDEPVNVQSKGIISLGTMMVKDFGGYTNESIVAYLGDLGRPAYIPPNSPKVSFTKSSKNSSGGAMVGGPDDYFSNDHQGN